MVNAIDNWLIGQTQRMYDWIWNFAGITKGLINGIILTIIVSYFIHQQLEQPNVIMALLAAIYLLILWHATYEHKQQVNRNYTAINARAMKHVDSTYHFMFRTLVNPFIFIVVLTSPVSTIPMFVASISFYIWGYTSTILVRDRETTTYREAYHAQ